MKYCPNCGSPLDDNASFCSTCGKLQQNYTQEPVEPEVNTDHSADQAAQEAPSYGATSPGNAENITIPYDSLEPATAKKSVKKPVMALIFGIAGLYCGIFGFYPLIGWIFALIGLGLSIAGLIIGNKSFITNPGSRMGKVGRNLSIAGLIVSIVLFFVGLFLSIVYANLIIELLNEAIDGGYYNNSYYPQW